jgi:hypothetical protein
VKSDVNIANIANIEEIEHGRIIANSGFPFPPTGTAQLPADRL